MFESYSANTELLRKNKVVTNLTQLKYDLCQNNSVLHINQVEFLLMTFFPFFGLGLFILKSDLVSVVTVHMVYVILDYHVM